MERKATPFVEVLEAADMLTLDEQETLVDILHRRVIDHRRAELAKDISEAQREFQSGACQLVTPDQLMGEVLS